MSLREWFRGQGSSPGVACSAFPLLSAGCRVVMGAPGMSQESSLSPSWLASLTEPSSSTVSSASRPNSSTPLSRSASAAGWAEVTVRSALRTRRPVAAGLSARKSTAIPRRAASARSADHRPTESSGSSSRRTSKAGRGFSGFSSRNRSASAASTAAKRRVRAMRSASTTRAASSLLATIRMSPSLARPGSKRPARSSVRRTSAARGPARTSRLASNARATGSAVGPDKAMPDRSVNSTGTGWPSRVPISRRPGCRRRSLSLNGNAGASSALLPSASTVPSWLA